MATKLDMAEQQLYGWRCAIQGEPLIRLVQGMGLTATEWKKLNNDSAVGYLTDEERNEVDEYFQYQNTKSENNGRVQT